MKAIILAILAFSLSQAVPVWAQGSRSVADPKVCYTKAKQELEAMLAGKDKLSYEKAIFLIENAWVDNRATYREFQDIINYGTANIRTIMSQLHDPAPKKNPENFFDALRQKSKEDQGYLPMAQANFAIYKYMTDTTCFIDLDKSRIDYHWPYRYAVGDPLGSGDWRNTQVANLLVNGMGNCFAFASLLRIYAERLGSGANICTAPSHIYIRHKDENGTNFNIEVASHAFPGTGTLSTLTYTTQDAIKSGISLRELDLQQSIALCLVYLAKGYEHKLGTAADDDFMMDCATSALRFDSLNLNAMLLKAELLEKRLLTSGKTIAQLQGQADFKIYETLLDKMHRLGYREMPLAMKNTLVKGWTRDSITYLARKNYLNKPGKNSNQTRYASLSWGLFDEDIADKPTERYGQTLFSTKKHKITGFAKEQTLYNNYSFDPVLFALNVDPLAHKFPQWSPYAAMGVNPILNIDPDGRAFIVSNGNKADKNGRAFFEVLNARSGGIFQMDRKGNVTFAAGKSLADVQNGNGVSLTLATAVANGIEAKQDVYFRAEGRNDQVFADNFQTGAVDVDDIQHMDNTSQAAVMSHFITERYATNDYEGRKDAISKDHMGRATRADKMKSEYWKAHQSGIDAERSAIGDMTGIAMPANGKRDELNPEGYTIWDYGEGVSIDFQRGVDPKTGSNTNVISGTTKTP